MFCTKCGAELPEGTKFCPACGTPVGAAGVASSTAPATPSPEAGAQTSEDPLARFWNSPKFGWAAVYFNRILNYVYVGLGLLLLAYGWWALALVLIIGGALGVYTVFGAGSIIVPIPNALYAASTSKSVMPPVKNAVHRFLFSR